MELKDKIKILFFDVDFTTFDHVNFMIRPLTMYALKSLKENGYKLCISTSRSIDEMSKLDTEFLPLMDGKITCGGGLAIVNDELIYKTIDKEDVYKAVEYLDKNNIVYRYVTSDNKCYLNRSEKEIDDFFYRSYTMIPTFKKYEGEDLVQLIYYPPKDFDKHEQVRNLLKNSELYNLHYTNEISPKGIDKGELLKTICNKFNFSLEEAMAFGDSENDNKMIELSAFGVCMGNGEEGTKKIADYVCEDISEDGLYKTLVKYNFIKESE